MRCEVREEKNWLQRKCVSVMKTGTACMPVCEFYLYLRPRDGDEKDETAAPS